MNRFPSDREATEFVAAKIAEQAQREGVPLSEVERKMLYFSETDWTLPDMMEVSDEFDKEYDQKDYEKKIAGLIRRLVKRIRRENREEYDSWFDAIKVLNEGDHYVLVMVRHARAATRPGHLDTNRPQIVAVALVAVVFLWGYCGTYLLNRFHIDEGDVRDQHELLVWTTLVGMLVVYVLGNLILGRDRMGSIEASVLEFIFLPKRLRQRLSRKRRGI